MKNTPPSAQTEYGAVNNPSYDKSLSPEQRLRDFMGAYHIVLHGVNAHEPFYLKYEGKPNERCDDEDKNSFVRFLNILVEDIKASERTRLLSVESMKMKKYKCDCPCHMIVPDELNNCDCVRFHKK